MSRKPREKDDNQLRASFNSLREESRQREDKLRRYLADVEERLRVADSIRKLVAMLWDRTTLK